MQLQNSMELAGQNLLNNLCPAHQYMPYYKIDIDREYRAWALLYCPAENIGRWWDAMLRLEAATGFVIPANIEAAMLENLYVFFDNPDHLCVYPLDDARYDPVYARFLLEFHSLREALLTLAALADRRNSRYENQSGPDDDDNDDEDDSQS